MSATIAAQETIQLLYCDHHGWLHGWLRKQLGNSFDAADLAHDTFLRVMTSQRLMSLGDEPRAFLTDVAKKVVIDHWRRREIERAYLETIAHLPQSQVPSEEARLLIQEAIAVCDAMLFKLGARTRKIFLMAQLEGLTYQQIAEVMSVSLITVKRHMRDAFVACMQAV
ncbi:sigma-70 family RNA polymerase sigma factor [Herbaspirillum sp. YR522]|uniref:sigma-70 family RNA polymerase sigma factor n=1 Tax=Herbaspirillum sp. YR522 TaxID=1144342 RepID=UPI00026FC4A3|nr:sigma-70 family RNA polymerase sigma factor [Herbaspirillum sp. YR522]EJN07618.1 RNA polymerase sigma factor, sigma-70 family [Herbaspirillum sp. YR522]